MLARAFSLENDIFGVLVPQETECIDILKRAQYIAITLVAGECSRFWDTLSDRSPCALQLP